MEKINKFKLDWKETAEIYAEKYNIMRDKAIDLYVLVLGSVALICLNVIMMLNILTK